MAYGRALGVALGAVGLLGLALAIIAFPAGAASGGGEQAKANIARSCSLSSKQQRSIGSRTVPTYVLTLSVRRMKCAAGRRVAGAYHNCRRSKPKGGKRGHCTRRVRRFRCREGSRNRGPSQFDATVTCKRGGKQVTHRYFQFF